MPQNMVTIQLSVPALEKLFEGDPEFKLSIKKAAIIEFSTRAISGLMDEAMKSQIRFEIEKQVGKITEMSYTKQVTLQPGILATIRAEATLAVDRELNSLRVEITKAAAQAVKTFESAISTKFKSEFREMVNQEVRKRMLAAME